MVKTAIRLLNGEKPESFATSFNGYKNALALVAVSETNLIKGHVVHMDIYGNAVTNVHQTLFERFGKDTPFVLYFKRKDYFIDIIIIGII